MNHNVWCTEQYGHNFEIIVTKTNIVWWREIVFSRSNKIELKCGILWFVLINIWTRSKICVADNVMLVTLCYWYNINFFNFGDGMMISVILLVNSWEKNRSPIYGPISNVKHLILSPTLTVINIDWTRNSKFWKSESRKSETENWKLKFWQSSEVWFPALEGFSLFWLFDPSKSRGINFNSEPTSHDNTSHDTTHVSNRKMAHFDKKWKKLPIFWEIIIKPRFYLLTF